jgi:hypothetical protein
VKRISIFLLLLIAGMAVAILWGINSVAESQPDKPVNASATGEDSEAVESDTARAASEVVAYYFHTTYRCASCKKIEAYSKEAIETGFAEQLKSGKLKFLSVNIDETENKHFVKDYQLYTKSLVICDLQNGKQTQWKNLAKVWELIRNKDEFVRYVQDEINAYLKES